MKNKSTKFMTFLAAAISVGAFNPKGARAWAPEVTLACHDGDYTIGEPTGNKNLHPELVYKIVSGKSYGFFGVKAKHYLNEDRLEMFSKLLSTLENETNANCVDLKVKDISDAIAGVCDKISDKNKDSNEAPLLAAMVKTAASQADANLLTIDDLNNALNRTTECAHLSSGVLQESTALWNANKLHALARQRQAHVESISEIDAAAQIIGSKYPNLPYPLEPSFDGSDKK